MITNIKVAVVVLHLIQCPIKEWVPLPLLYCSDDSLIKRLNVRRVDGWKIADHGISKRKTM